MARTPRLRAPREYSDGDWPDGPPGDDPEWPHAPAAVAAAQRVARNVRATRRAAGHTQQRLAELAAISVRTIKKIEAGRTWPDLVTLTGIAEALETTPASLLSDGVTPRPRRTPGAAAGS